MSRLSVWQRMIYQHRDWIEERVRRLHDPVVRPGYYCGYTTHGLMGISYKEIIERAREHLCRTLAAHYWEDPVL